MGKIPMNMRRVIITATCMFFVPIVTCHAEDAFSLAKQGALALSQTNYDLAIKYYTDAIKLVPNYDYAFFGRGQAYAGKLQFEKAIEDCDKAIAYTSYVSTKASAFGTLGSIYSTMGEYDKAITNDTESIKIRPDFFGIYVNRANVYIQTGQYGSAINDCNVAISLKPGEAYIYSVRADAERGKNDFEAAIADYNATIKLDPNNHLVYLGRSRAFVGKSEYKQAAEDLSKFLEFETNNDSVYASRGVLLSMAGEYGRGIDDCRKAVALNTESTIGNNNLAWLLAVAPDAKLRDGLQAVKYAQIACDLTKWKNGDCLGTLAAAYAEASNFQEAVKWQKESMKFDKVEADLKDAQKRLDLYESGKPYHEEPKVNSTRQP